MRKIAIMVCLTALAFSGRAANAQSARPRQARQILDTAGVEGGIVVHLGCGDGKLTAALHVNDSYLIHGLDTDPADIEAALLMALSAAQGEKLTERRLDGVPVFDGLAAAGGNLYISMTDGRVICMTKE